MINACKLNSKSSSIKLELPEPSTKKSRSRLQERWPCLSRQKTYGDDT